MPRLASETYGTGDQSWLGSTHGIYNCRTATIDISAFTAGTHYPNGHLPSGLPVNVDNEGAVLPWTGAAGENLGFVYTDQKVSGTKDFAVPVLLHGIVKIDKLPVALILPTTATAFVFTGTGA
jgi:hypothetical protein